MTQQMQSLELYSFHAPPSQISFNLPASRDRRHRVASHGNRLPLVGPEQIKEEKKRGKNADAITYADGDASLIRLVWNPLFRRAFTDSLFLFLSLGLPPPRKSVPT